MKEDRLKELIDKYYSGNTSTEEEREIREYFAGNNIIQGYEIEKEIFSGFDSISDAIPSPPEDLEEAILRSVDNVERKSLLRAKTLRMFIPAGIAATLLLAVGMYFFLTGKQQPTDTFKDPMIAYAETIKILNEVSVKLNKGTAALGSLGQIRMITGKSIKSIEKPATLLSNSLQKLKLIDKIQDSGSQIRIKDK